jgi:hypothetical protein
MGPTEHTIAYGNFLFGRVSTTERRGPRVLDQQQ